MIACLLQFGLFSVSVLNKIREVLTYFTTHSVCQHVEI